MMPNVASWLLLIFAGIDFFFQIFGSLVKLLKDTKGTERDVSFGLLQVVAIIITSGVLALYSWGLHPVGYILSSFLLVFLLMPVLGARFSLKLGGISASAVFLLFVLMKYGFGSTFTVFPAFLGG
jgi:hypothetical protein